MSTSGTSRRRARTDFIHFKAEQQAVVSRRASAAAIAMQAVRDQEAAAKADEMKINATCRAYPFWLTQRLISTSIPNEVAFIARYFSLDYMGSVEFETSAFYESSKRIRDFDDHVILPVEMTRDAVTRTVYVVAPTHDLERKIIAFQHWFASEHLQGKERSEFDVVFLAQANKYLDLDSWNKGYVKTDAWWSFDCDMLWTLDRDLAEKLLAGMKAKA